MAKFGIITPSGLQGAVSNYQHDVHQGAGFRYTPGAGTMYQANVYCCIVTSGGTNQVRVHLYSWNAAKASRLLVASSSIANVTATSLSWLSFSMTGTLLAGVTYVIDVQGYNSVASRLRIGIATAVWQDSCHLSDTDFVAPANLGGAADGNVVREVNIDYTPGGAAPAGGNDEDAFNPLIIL